MSEDKNKPYTDEEVKELFEGVKEGLAEKHPEIADEIKLCSTGDEIDELLKRNRGETKPQSGAEAPKTLGVVRHVHELLTKEKEGTKGLDLGGQDLSKTGGQIPLQNLGEKPQSWESHEQMLDDLFKLEMLGKIESTRDKPNREIIEKGSQATEMIEKLYKSGMKQGRLKRAGKDLLRGRYEFEEPEWIRQLMNPEGRKRAKEKPYLVERI